MPGETFHNASAQGLNAATKGRKDFALAFIVLLNCLNVAGLISNTIIISVYRRNRQLKTKSNIIIVSMAITSIVLALSEIICSTGVLVSWSRWRCYLTRPWCVLQSCLEVILCHFIIHAIAAMAIQRQSIISKILKPNIQTKLLKTKILLLATLAYITLVSLPLFAYFQTSWVNVTIFLGCEISKGRTPGKFYYRTAYIGVLFAIPFMVIFSNYIYIHYRIKNKSLSVQRDLKRSQLRKGPILRPDSYSGFNIAVILLFSTLFSTPTEILSLLFVEGSLFEGQTWLFYTATVMSKVYEMFSATVHACASTRYRVKLRKSFAASGITDFYSGQQKESVASQRRCEASVPDERLSTVQNIRRRRRYTTYSGGKFSDRQGSFDKGLRTVSLQTNETVIGSVSTRYEPKMGQSDGYIQCKKENFMKAEEIELNVLRDNSNENKMKCSNFKMLKCKIKRRMTDSELAMKKSYKEVAQLRLICSLSQISSIEQCEPIWRKWQLEHFSLTDKDN